MEKQRNLGIWMDHLNANLIDLDAKKIVVITPILTEGARKTRHQRHHNFLVTVLLNTQI
jgi:hypothetical protein